MALAVLSTVIWQLLKIGAAVVDVLASPTFRANAGELARMISTSAGAIAAASRLERLGPDGRR